MPVVYTIDNPAIIPYKRYEYKTAKPIKVIIDKKLFVIPEGFTTDLASIPRFFWSIYSPHYVGFILPAIIHDFLYRSPVVHSRQYADRVFFAALLNNGISYWTAFKFYIVVRVFGMFSYKGDS